ncbi:MAG: hypothetical protein ABJ370_07485 [Paracoccaceae bacterium]
MVPLFSPFGSPSSGGGEAADVDALCSPPPEPGPPVGRGGGGGPFSENNAVTVEDREAAQLRAAEIAVAAGRLTEDDLRELREFNEEREIESDGEGGVRE